MEHGSVAEGAGVQRVGMHWIASAATEVSLIATRESKRRTNRPERMGTSLHGGADILMPAQSVPSLLGIGCRFVWLWNQHRGKKEKRRARQQIRHAAHNCRKRTGPWRSVVYFLLTDTAVAAEELFTPDALLSISASNLWTSARGSEDFAARTGADGPRFPSISAKRR